MQQNFYVRNMENKKPFLVDVFSAENLNTKKRFKYMIFFLFHFFLFQVPSQFSYCNDILTLLCAFKKVETDISITLIEAIIFLNANYVFK